MLATHVEGKGRLRAAIAGLALASALATVPAASADTTRIASRGSGLTAPGGIARDSNGATWIADALRGVCKLDPAAPGGDALVVDGTWCISAANAAAGVVGAGPTAAFQMAYDTDTSSLFV